MPGRSFSAGDSYRYGFNGKEKDNEVKGEGSQQDYGMRVYDPRLGRFLSVDPIERDFPELTPFQYAGNKPIWCIDLDGLEDLPYYWQMKEQVLWQNAKTPEQAEKLRQTETNVRNSFILAYAIAADLFITKGYVTNALFMSQALGAFEHNRAKTPEGRAAQDQRRNEALANAFVTWGVGKMVGGISKAVLASGDVVYKFRKADFDALVFDPDKGKVTSDAIQELRVALTAESEVGTVMGRAKANTGADFVTTKGLIDVKGADKFIDAANSSNKREFLQLLGTIKANKDVKYVIDFSHTNATAAEWNTAIQKFYKAGVDKSQIIIPSQQSVQSTKIKTF